MAQDGAITSAAGFDPRSSCGTVLRGATELDKMMVAAWVFGFIGGRQGDLHVVNFENNKQILQRLFDACAKDESKSLHAIIVGDQRGEVDNSGSEESARKVLMRFMQPGADLAVLTTQLKPSVADIRAVYAEPLAGKLIEMYGTLFSKGAKIGPKQDQTELIITRATTGALRSGDPVLQEFPGGYKKIRNHFVGNQPIVRFKFAKQGETLGMAFDGLIYVNDRWVLMPKPWRAVE